MIRASVLGATGYAGVELIRLLLGHPDVSIAHLASRSYEGQKISDIYPNLKGISDKVLCKMEPEKIASDSDVVFTALPHGVSLEVVPALYAAGAKVIDLSGDFRYDDKDVYEEWYGKAHPCPELMAQAVYGLCELKSEEIKGARLIGNPGCYTTCSILGAAPLVKEGLIDASSIIIDAKSGVTGAGRASDVALNFCETNENLKAYKIAVHRHASEIEQELSSLAGKKITLTFTPHLVPMKRGIFTTIYGNLITDVSQEELIEIYRKVYKNAHFVRVLENEKFPELKYVNGSNFTDIGIKVDIRNRRVIVLCALDNLIKGAAGQAVQNMNLLFSLDEKTGLAMPGYYM